MWVSTWRHGCERPEEAYRETVTETHPITDQSFRPYCPRCGQPERLTGWTEVKKAESVRRKPRARSRKVQAELFSLFK